MEPQERALKAGVDIVVATPGRLLDHMRSNVGDFSKLEVFVLDEADRMMDMGFWPDVRSIAEALPPPTARQTMLFSATMPEEVMRFADALAPTRCSCRSDRAAVRRRRSRTKRASCRRARRRRSSRSICAARTSRRSSSSTRRSAAIGWRASSQPTGLRAAAIHADRSQKDRTAAIESFRAGRTKVLVATDVAARGLDIDDVGAHRQLRSAARARHLRPSRRPHRPQRRQGPRAHAGRSVRTPRSRSPRKGVRFEIRVGRSDLFSTDQAHSGTGLGRLARLLVPLRRPAARRFAARRAACSSSSHRALA